jgi:hypothetical protein
MKKFISFIVPVFIAFSLFSQTQWHTISKATAVDFAPKLIHSSTHETVIEFSLEGFHINDVSGTPIANSKSITVPRGGRMSQAGNPDISKLTAPIIIPDMANMQVQIVETEFFDIENIEIAPSRGDFSRGIDPSTVPFTYGQVYQQNQWFPGNLADISNPHIFRDFRGAVVMAYPFQYNPVQKKLRVYNKIVVQVVESQATQQIVNPFNRTKSISSIVQDFHYMYLDRYINYFPNKYTAPLERGNILVICHDAFIPDMMPYVNWKNQIGFPTEIVGVSTIGNNTTAIKNYLTSYYNTNGLAFLLLVGDHTEVVTYNYGSANYSDNWYGDILGNDSYLEVIVGRFSATTSAHVQTQVQRTLEYERAEGMANGWLSTGIGVAHNEGPGHHGEYDHQHIDFIRDTLLNYHYTTVHREYTSVSGVTNTTASQISSRINTGAGIINYCNHGSETGWSVANYNNSHVNALTNVKKLPFIWSVACVNGQFTRSGGDCFAEAWLKATDASGEPTGAIAVYMSTINQPWVPPMDAQDEFNRMLTENIAGATRRSFGAISTSGTMFMLDLGPSNSQRLETARTWTIFGDPSIMVRTDDPLSMNVSHLHYVANGTDNLLVNCNIEGAFVTLTINYEIIGTGVISGGSANINFAPLMVGDTVLVTVTAFNTIPYEGTVLVELPTIPWDMQAASITDLEGSYSCSGIPVTPKAVIRNMGINTVTSCTIHYQLNSNPEQSIQWTGSLASLESDTVSLPSHLLSVGTHTYSYRVSNPNGNQDGNTSNDVFQKSYAVQDLPLVADFAVNSNEFCAAPAAVGFSNISQNASSYFMGFRRWEHIH